MQKHLEAIHSEILSLIDPKDMTAKIMMHMKGLETSYNTVAKVDLKLNELFQQQYLVTQYSISYPSISVSRAQPISGQSRLPKIGLPEFLGEPIECQGFWDQSRYQQTSHMESLL